MAGIVFPVLLHLWNHQQGKVLRIGSITFMEKNSLRQARSRRLSEWWLLLLRCLLLLLLALLLSAPFWQKTSPEGKIKGWVLAVKDEAPAPAYQSLIDSLLKAGYQRHEWGSGLKWPSGQVVSREGGHGEGASYWDIFRMMDRKAPAGIPFYIFTSGLQTHFTGQRPATNRIVHWITMPSADSIDHWIGQAWLSSPDSIRVLIGSSGPTGNSYTSRLMPVKVGALTGSGDSLPAGDGCHVGVVNGHLSVALDSQPPVMVDTAALQVRIYADNKYNHDSRYVVAALQALKQFTRRNIQISTTPSQRPDWIFWLSSTPVPAGLTASNILRYEEGREIPADTWIHGMAGVAISRRIENDAANGHARKYQDIWKDGFGRPILSAEQSSEGHIFHFFSHFDPAWNGLVWSPRFPVLLDGLLTGEKAYAGVGTHDRRVLDPEQILPQQAPAGKLYKSSEATAGAPDRDAGSGYDGLIRDGNNELMRDEGMIDLTPACWVVLFLLFLAERTLALRSPKIKSYG